MISTHVTYNVSAWILVTPRLTFKAIVWWRHCFMKVWWDAGGGNGRISVENSREVANLIEVLWNIWNIQTRPGTRDKIQFGWDVKTVLELDGCVLVIVPTVASYTGVSTGVELCWQWGNGVGDRAQSRYIHKKSIIKSLGHSDAICRWRSWSTLVQVMACCLTAPSHYLN